MTNGRGDGDGRRSMQVRYSVYCTLCSILQRSLSGFLKPLRSRRGFQNGPFRALTYCRCKWRCRRSGRRPRNLSRRKITCVAPPPGGDSQSVACANHARARARRAFSKMPLKSDAQALWSRTLGPSSVSDGVSQDQCKRCRMVGKPCPSTCLCPARPRGGAPSRVQPGKSVSAESPVR